MNRTTLTPTAILGCLVLCAASYGADTQSHPAATAVRSMAAGLAEGRPIVVWEGLPASYQSDINDLVQMFGRNMDAEVWSQANSLLNNVHDVLATKQQFVLNYPAIKNSPTPEKTRAAITQGTKTLKTLVDAGEHLDDWKIFDGAEFLNTTGKEVAMQMKELAAMSDETTSGKSALEVKVDVLESTDSSAKLQLTSPDGQKKEVVDFIFHSGKWLPKKMVDGWDEGVQKAKAGLEQMPEQIAPFKGQVSMVTMAVTGMLAPLKAAETQEQFDTAVDGVIANVKGMVGGMMR